MQHDNRTHWCESLKVVEELCLQPATIFLMVKIGDEDENPRHGFCNRHAGIVAGMLANEGEIGGNDEVAV